MTKGFLLAAAAVAAVSSASPAFGQDRATASREFAYFLPRTRAIVRVDQLIRRCPTADQHAPLITSTAAVVDRAGPDPAAMIRVDASSGFLSGRTTKLVLRPDGTLISFNASTTGEGGAVLSSLIGAATTVASLAIGMPPVGLAPNSMVAQGLAWRRPPPPRFECTHAVRELVARMQEVEANLDALRANIAQGTEAPGSAEVLAALTAELASLVDRLTLSTDPHIFDPAPEHFDAQGDGRPNAGTVALLAPIDYTPWFGTNSDSLRGWLAERGVPGGYGFRATVAPNRALLGALSHGDDSSSDQANPTPRGSRPTPYLYYRRPVPGTVALVPCAQPAVNGDCAPDGTRPGQAASVQKTVQFPQLSGLFSIRIGRGSLFGTRQAAAEFDAYGAPTALQYGSTAGGAEIAGVIDSAGTATTTLRDARTGALNRRLEREKAIDELNALLEARETQGAGQ